MKAIAKELALLPPKEEWDKKGVLFSELIALPNQMIFIVLGGFLFLKKSIMDKA
jgi:hypothetical protein